MPRQHLPLLVVLFACSEPLGPQSASPAASVSFRTLGPGDTMYVDQHSVGCFSVADAHLMLVGTPVGIVVSGEVISSIEFASSIEVAKPNHRAPVPSRLLTSTELRFLDNLLDLYRRDEHQTRCMSTGQQSTRFRTTRGAAEQHDTDSCIEMEFVDDSLGFTTRPRADIMSLYEITRPAFEALWRP